MWEPILPTDFSAPTTGVLRRARDRRVQQYWDPGHVLAKQMAADARPPQPKQDCCVRSGTLWDLVAVYSAGSRWDEKIPPAKVFNGPVVDVTDEIKRAIGR